MTSDAQIRIVLVDDHRMVRVGLASMLDAAQDMQVVGEAGDGAEAVALLGDIDADVVLMDLSMPILDGVEATRRVREVQPSARVVVLSSFADQKRVRDAMSAGAVGYVLKDCAPDELLGAVRSAAAGHNPLDARVAGALLPSAGATNSTGSLSDREIQVLRLAAKGLANKQIGRTLGISERTVKVHLGNVFRRIDVTDRTSAALWARENLPPED